MPRITPTPAPKKDVAAIPEGPYMGPKQLDYFRRKLEGWRQELLDEAQSTIDDMRDERHFQVGDEGDRAARESSQTLELRARDRQRKLLRKIEQALARIDRREYGYCEDTGEPIGLERLDIRPVATLCLDAQEVREIRERYHRR